MLIRGTGRIPVLGSESMKITFTGHRHLKYKDVISKLDELHRMYPDAIWITGGAIGLDSHAAEYARTHRITLWLILPFSPKVMALKWNTAQRTMLESHIKYCSKLSILSPIYNVSIYQDRNIRMVDLSDMLAAFFDGSPGGTGNCVKYAQLKGHDIKLCL